MASGYENQLTRQIGEHLVTAELGRQLQYTAAPFAGNLPLYDLFAGDRAGNAIPIQVKTIWKPTWQLDVRAFLDIEIAETGQRVIGLRSVNSNLVCVYVWLSREDRTKDRFYIFPATWLQSHIQSRYKPRMPPKNINSTHHALAPNEIAEHENQWHVIEDAVREISRSLTRPPNPINATTKNQSTPASLRTG